MAFVKIWIHAVWATKYRDKWLLPEIKNRVCAHIIQNAAEKGFYIAEINGHLDHLHCLMPLKSDWSIAKQMQMIKGESAFWVNKNQLLPGKIEWAVEYYAASVSERNLDVVRNYIRNQEQHHHRQSFEEEYTLFLKQSGFDQG